MFISMFGWLYGPLSGFTLVSVLFSNSLTSCWSTGKTKCCLAVASLPSLQFCFFGGKYSKQTRIIFSVGTLRSNDL